MFENPKREPGLDCIPKPVLNIRPGIQPTWPAGSRIYLCFYRLCLYLLCMCVYQHGHGRKKKLDAGANMPCGLRRLAGEPGPGDTGVGPRPRPVAVVGRWATPGGPGSNQCPAGPHP